MDKKAILKKYDKMGVRLITICLECGKINFDGTRPLTTQGVAKAMAELNIAAFHPTAINGFEIDLANRTGVMQFKF